MLFYILFKNVFLQIYSYKYTHKKNKNCYTKKIGILFNLES